MLNPCPFCGSRNVHFYISEDPRISYINFITCRDCGAVVSFRGREDRKQSLEVWNKRK